MIIAYSIVVTMALFLVGWVWREDRRVLDIVRDERDEAKDKLMLLVRTSGITGPQQEDHIAFLESLARDLVEARTYESKRTALICVYLSGNTNIAADVSERLLKVLNETYPWKAERLLAKAKKNEV